MVFRRNKTLSGIDFQEEKKMKTLEKLQIPPGFHNIQAFTLLEALMGRRSRRFFRGAEIADGVFAYKSRRALEPLSELEKLLVVTACGGNTSWHNLIYRAENYAPQLSNYAGAAGGRTFPSAAGFHTSMTFFTDDEGRRTPQHLGCQSSWNAASNSRRRLSTAYSSLPLLYAAKWTGFDR